jgi:hypothetical protein
MMMMMMMMTVRSKGAWSIILAADEPKSRQARQYSKSWTLGQQFQCRVWIDVCRLQARYIFRWNSNSQGSSASTFPVFLR